jgi:hypothetical protein
MTWIGLAKDTYRLASIIEVLGKKEKFRKPPTLASILVEMWWINSQASIYIEAPARIMDAWWEFDAWRCGGSTQRRCEKESGLKESPVEKP